MSRGLLVLAVVFAGVGLVLAGPTTTEKSSVERGRDALLGRSFSPPIVSVNGYENAWKQWGMPEKPADYASAFAERYGLHAAPYENHGLPMGLRETRSLLGKGIGTDCMLCHAGSIAGQSYIGLGNSTIDFHGLFQELAVADGLSDRMPYRFSNVRGTIEAAASTVYLFSFRDNDLKVREPTDMGPLHDQLCEDVPAWWLMKKKKTMYHTGQINSRSVRSLMAFMLSPLTSGEAIKKQEPVFADIQAYLLSLEPPKYPFPVNTALAARGKELFNDTCSRCHGTYGDNWTYASKIVPPEVVGTDRSLLDSFSDESTEKYRVSWFGQEKGRDGQPYEIPNARGYQAPPLDGVWATAPYFHNGSVPRLHDVLDSKSRPRIYTRSFRTGTEDYDTVNVGWKILPLEKGPDDRVPARERRKVYDTTQPGRGNGGHTFGDDLTDDERRAVIEYLKTL
jgi:hypothetical protein